MKLKSLQVEKDDKLFEVIIDEQDSHLFEGVTLYIHKSLRGRYTPMVYYQVGRAKHQSVGEFLIGKVEGKVVDHIDRNNLNNSRSNLRHVSCSENVANQGLKATNTSGYKGVTKTECGFRAKLKINGRQHIKTCKTAVEAAKQYDEFVNTYRPGFPTNLSLGLLPIE